MTQAVLIALQFCYTTHCCLDSAKPTQLTSRHLRMKLLLILIYSLDAVINCHSYIINGTTGRGQACCKHEFLNLVRTLICSSDVQYGNVIGAVIGSRT